MTNKTYLASLFVAFIMGFGLTYLIGPFTMGTDNTRHLLSYSFTMGIIIAFAISVVQGLTLINRANAAKAVSKNN